MSQSTEREHGQGHPLPDSEEAREGEVPEHLVDGKGHGDDAHAPARGGKDAVAPDGTPYPTANDPDVAH